jgi:hypothetical protein
MILDDCGGPNRLTIQVAGYQFPDAPDPALRFSWHMISGHARCDQGSWQFHWQALTCDESPRISAWLRDVAESQGQSGTAPPPLYFAEPNLGFRATTADSGRLGIQVSFDLEFRPPWHRHGRAAGDPFNLTFTMDEGQLRRAAAEWDAERAPFPDGAP